MRDDRRTRRRGGRRKNYELRKKRARPIPDSPHVPSLISHADDDAADDAADDALTNFDKKEGRKIEECLLGDLRKLKLGRVNEVP